MKEELIDIKDNIVKELQPLALESQTDPQTKFELLVQAIRFDDGVADQSLQLYRQAHECALAIEDPRDKFDALASLLEEVNISLSVIDEKTNNETSEQQ